MKRLGPLHNAIQILKLLEETGRESMLIDFLRLEFSKLTREEIASDEMSQLIETLKSPKPLTLDQKISAQTKLDGDESDKPLVSGLKLVTETTDKKGA